MRSPRALLTVAVLCAPLLLGSRCRPSKEEPDVVVPSDVNPPEVRLQVLSIDPAQAPSGEAFPATVFGAEFEAGAEVLFQDRPADRVTWADANTLDVTVPALPMGVYDVVVRNPGGERAVLRKGLSVTGLDVSEACRAFTIWFDLDSFEVRADAQSTLADRAACLQGARGTIRVEGHCDERGTTEYNLTLGEKRAHAVRRALTGLGVSPSRVLTVSYGEERPAASGHDEDAWSRNRRAEIVLED